VRAVSDAKISSVGVISSHPNRGASTSDTGGAARQLCETSGDRSANTHPASLGFYVLTRLQSCGKHTLDKILVK
jgi:hypothetical protein